MNTWSHLLVNAALNRPIKTHQAKTKSPKLPPISTKAFLVGSVLPDLMLILMGASALIYDLATGIITLDMFRDGPPDGSGPPPGFQQSTVGKLFDDWFFNDPWVKTGHSIFGTPIMLILYIVVGYYLWKYGRKWGPALFWLGVGCMIHTLVDIPLHTDDGPLLFWPFNWWYRFESPVSYWDVDHHAATWVPIENGLNLLLLIWLIGGWLWRRFRPN